MQILTPGTSAEFNSLMLSTYNNGSPTYTRLSEYENTESYDVEFGKAHVIKQGREATVICFGNMLSTVVKACENLDVTILYYTTVIPFDIDTLINNFNERLIICEPFYQGSINHEITNGLQKYKYNIHNIGIPRKFLLNYGTKEQHDNKLGLNVEGVKNKIELCLN